MTLDLTPEERRALAVLLKGTINEGHPHSPRIRVLRRILGRLEPPARERVSIQCSATTFSPSITSLVIAFIAKLFASPITRIGHPPSPNRASRWYQAAKSISTFFLVPNISSSPVLQVIRTSEVE